MRSFVEAQSTERAGARRVTCTLAVLALVAAPFADGNAQLMPNQYVGTLSYTTAAPAGDSKDFANNFSWLGFTVEGDWFIRWHVGAG